MKLATFLAPGGERPLAGEVDGARVTAFAGGARVVDVLSGDVEPALDAESWPLSEVTLLAPVPDPGTVYAIGMNYAAHVAETGAEPPPAPVVFVKVGGSVAPPGGPIRCPEVVRRLDYEGELVIVMGAGGRIAGYCIADDVTARDLQGREPQWTRAKGADTFCPYGPWITTADEVSDPGNLQLRTWVNRELRQDSNTSDLIFGCRGCRVHRPDVHAAAGRPHPDRHAERRRNGARSATVFEVRRHDPDPNRRTGSYRASGRVRGLSRSGEERRGPCCACIPARSIT